MSREIKFRVWDLQQKIWRNFLYVNIVTWGVSGNDKSDYIFQQFTGLKDKNGKEIYEGDILIQEHGEKYVVEFEISGYNSRFVCKNLTKKWNFGAATSEFLTIIGNIYENPELLA